MDMKDTESEDIAVKLQEHPRHTNTRPRHAVRRRMQGLLCIIAALATAVVGLSIYTAVTADRHRQSAAAMSAELDTMRSQVSALESHRAADASQLAQQSEAVEALESRVDEQASKIQKQNKTIAAQKKQIEALKKVTTTKKTEKGATTTTKKTTTTKPPKTTVMVNGATKQDKLIALTFDDGPSSETTGKLLDALKKRKVKATFFVLGSRINKTTAPLLKRMEAEGHVVANHSMNHKNLRYQSAAGIKAEMDACSKKIKEVLGHNPVIMRCPGGNYDEEVKDYARNAGMAIVQWSVDTRDWESRNAKKIVNTAFNDKYSKIADGAIVLFHDIYSTSVDGAVKVIDRLKKEGYTMVTVPELLTLRKGGAIAGEVYVNAP